MTENLDYIALNQDCKFHDQRVGGFHSRSGPKWSYSVDISNVYRSEFSLSKVITTFEDYQHKH